VLSEKYYCEWMKQDNKSRRLFILIVTLLLIFQIVTCSCQAESTDSSTSSLTTPPNNQDPANTGSNNSTDDNSNADTGSSTSTPNSNGGTNQQTNQQTTNQPGSSPSSSLISSPLMLKYVNYVAALSTPVAKIDQLTIETTTSISGEDFVALVTADGQPVPDAIISFMDTSYVTNDEGTATITAPSNINGNFLMTAHKDGYQTGSTWVSVTDSNEAFSGSSDGSGVTSNSEPSPDSSPASNLPIVVRLLQKTSTLPLLKEFFLHYFTTVQ